MKALVLDRPTATGSTQGVDFTFRETSTTIHHMGKNHIHDSWQN